jgi:hypothetical protein
MVPPLAHKPQKGIAWCVPPSLCVNGICFLLPSLPSGLFRCVASYLSAVYFPDSLVRPSEQAKRMKIQGDLVLREQMKKITRFKNNSLAARTPSVGHVDVLFPHVAQMRARHPIYVIFVIFSGSKNNESST